MFKERDPAKIDWPSLGVEVVVESTGLFTNAEDAQKAHARTGEEGHHFRAGKERRHHDLHRRERQKLRSCKASHHFQCVVHDELPVACRESDS